MVLERYFQQKLWEEAFHDYRKLVGFKKGENEIDIVAVNRIDHYKRIASETTGINIYAGLERKIPKTYRRVKKISDRIYRLLIGGYVDESRHSHPYFMVRLSAGRYTMDYNMTRLELYISSIAFFRNLRINLETFCINKF